MPERPIPEKHLLSALADVNERRLYEALLFFVFHTTCVTLAHHDALRVCHDREIVFGSGKSALFHT